MTLADREAPAPPVPAAAPAWQPPPRRPGQDMLLSQLPRAMAQDPFLRQVVSVFEHVASTVRDGVDSIEHQLDVGLSSDAMLRYLGGWLGTDLDPAGDPARQRELLRAIGPLIGRRGTAAGLEGILEALTGARVRVHDGGGVWTRGEQVPEPDPVVLVEIDHLGDLTPAQLDAFLAAEVPIGVSIDLRVGR